jgi:hypothetical protein
VVDDVRSLARDILCHFGPGPYPSIFFLPPFDTMRSNVFLVSLLAAPALAATRTKPVVMPFHAQYLPLTSLIVLLSRS